MIEKELEINSYVLNVNIQEVVKTFNENLAKELMANLLFYGCLPVIMMSSTWTRL